MDKKKAIDTINKYLNKETFVVPLFRGVDDITISAKIELTGEKQLITLGEWENYITYTMHILKDDNNIIELVSHMMGNNRELNVTTYDSNSNIRHFDNFLSNELKNLFNYFGVDDYPILTKIINENISHQEIIKEEKYDGVTRFLVRDIIQVFKKNEEGEFSLPEDIKEGNLIYELSDNLEPFTIDLILDFDEDIEDYEIDGEYYRDDDTIVIHITRNPNQNKNKMIYNLIGDLNEIVRHELEHVKQKSQGYKFPTNTPKTPLGYYLRKHELDAQLKGFKRQSKIQNKNIDDVMKRWFERNQKKHNLTQKDIDKLVKKILNR